MIFISHQVVNYGIGGQYEAHYDYYEVHVRSISHRV